MLQHHQLIFQDLLKQQIVQLEKSRDEEIEDAQKRFRIEKLPSKSVQLHLQEQEEYSNLSPNDRQERMLIKEKYDRLFRSTSLYKKDLESAIRQAISQAVAKYEKKISEARREIDGQMICCQEARRDQLSKLNQQYRAQFLQTFEEGMPA